jgi:hypothetical protein
MRTRRLPGMGANHDVSRQFAPDFTTESTESTETDRKEGRVRIRIRNFFLLASVASVLSVVKLRIAHLAGESLRQAATVQNAIRGRRWLHNAGRGRA